MGRRGVQWMFTAFSFNSGYIGDPSRYKMPQPVHSTENSRVILVHETTPFPSPEFGYGPQIRSSEYTGNLYGKTKQKWRRKQADMIQRYYPQ